MITEQDLLNNGWEKHESGTFHHRETMNPKYGGHTLRGAIKRQEEYDIIDRNGSYYYPVACCYGYGYNILAVHDKMRSSIQQTLMISLTKENALKICNKFNTGEYSEDLNIDVQRFDKVLVLHEKHGDRYFMVPTIYDLWKAALKIVEERNKEGYWYSFDYEKPEEPVIPREQADLMKDCPIRRSIVKAWDDYEDALKDYEDSKKDEMQLKLLLKSKDGLRAMNFLANRRDYEYEGFEIIDCEKI